MALPLTDPTPIAVAAPQARRTRQAQVVWGVGWSLWAVTPRCGCSR